MHMTPERWVPAPRWDGVNAAGARANLPRRPRPSMSRRFLLLAAALVAWASPTLAQAPAQPRRVLTTFTVLADMARNVAGDRAAVESLIKPGGEIHDYDPTPGDLVRAQRADLVLWNGLGLERWFERFFQGARGVPSAVLTEGIEPISLVEGPYKGLPNPHAWMSPANAVLYVENIRRALAALDPAGADDYARNAARYAAEIRRLDAPIRERLARLPAATRVLVTCEGAFSYLARAYDLREGYLWAVNSEQEGSPQQVRRTIDRVRTDKVPVVFCESTVSDRAMRQVARETRARFGGVLYVDSLTAPDGEAPTYLRLLRTNADVILRGFDVAD